MTPGRHGPQRVDPDAGESKVGAGQDNAIVIFIVILLLSLTVVACLAFRQDGDEGVLGTKLALPRLVKEAKNWSAAAISSAGGGDAITLVEATRSATYLRAARLIAHDSIIERECGVDVQRLVDTVERLEADAIAKLSSEPALAATLS